jgi:hypothetical protein
MKLALKDILVRYMASHNEWKSKGHVTDTLSWGYIEKGVLKHYLSETVGRKLREAESESRLAVKQDGDSVQYKFLPPDRRKSYIPWSSRSEGKKNILFKI